MGNEVSTSELNDDSLLHISSHLDYDDLSNLRQTDRNMRRIVDNHPDRFLKVKQKKEEIFEFLVDIINDYVKDEGEVTLIDGPFMDSKYIEFTNIEGNLTIREGNVINSIGTKRVISTQTYPNYGIFHISRDIVKQYPFIEISIPYGQEHSGRNIFMNSEVVYYDFINDEYKRHEYIHFNINQLVDDIFQHDVEPYFELNDDVNVD